MDNFTKSDLKVGYVVQLRDGELRMVMKSEEGICFIDENWNCSRLIDYNDSFEHEENNSMSIDKIYGFSKFYFRTLDVSTDNRYLLWTRPKVTYKSKFLEAFPNAKINDSGAPSSCVSLIFGVKCCDKGCVKCWNQEYKESED